MRTTSDDAVRDWLAGDPDPADRAELTAVRDAAAGGDEAASADLADRFASGLAFGTAGLRGPLRAGPNGMNTAVVRRAAAGVAAWLTRTPRPVPPTVVIGFDARRRSASFAEDSARVLAGAGVRALLLPGPLPTPVLAYAVRALDADAGIMVTASHNPASDNGYKVYLGAAAGDPARGAQLVSPADAEIEAAIAAAPPAAALPLADTWTRLGGDLVEAYVAAAATTFAQPAPPPPAVVAYTPLHGVGSGVLRRVFAAAGLPEPKVVTEQAEPDPAFPTASFPNPEEPGVMDLVLALGATVGADVVLANDPDADRLAVAVGGRLLTGDEVGLLLADEALRHAAGPVATTVVSATALRVLAHRRGVPCSETLTGFKWIMRADPGLVFGYEEALGYAVRPDLVRDKDGITAAVAVARIAAAEKARGRTLLDRLADLRREVGAFVTDQVSIRVPALPATTALMDALRATPPASIGGLPVVSVRDLLRPGASGLPASDVLAYDLEDSARVVVRPSGTEPKLKIYLQARTPDRLARLAVWARGLGPGDG